MGLRTHAIGPIKQDPTPQDGCTTSKVAFKEEPDSQENNTRQDSADASQAHCSANSLHAQGHLQGVTARSDTVNKPACKMREVTADSEEVKRSSSREPDGGSPQSSNPASLGPHRLSSTQRQQSGDLQTGSGGECKTMTFSIYLSAGREKQPLSEGAQQDVLHGRLTGQHKRLACCCKSVLSASKVAACVSIRAIHSGSNNTVPYKMYV